MNGHEAKRRHATGAHASDGAGHREFNLEPIETDRIEIGIASEDTRGTCGTRLDAVFNLQPAGIDRA